MKQRTLPFNVQMMMLLLSFIVFLAPEAVQATETPHQPEAAKSYAIGIGAELIQGDYGVDANARLFTMPLTLTFYPGMDFDISVELPFLIASSSTGSTMLVTQSGGSGRRWWSTTSSTTTTTVATETTTTEAGLGDISLTAGWVILNERELLPELRPYAYLKVPTGNDQSGLGTGTYEAGPGLSASKWIDDLHLFADSSYIFQNSTDLYAGKDYLNFSGGIGFQLTDRLYTAALFKGATAKAEGGDMAREIRLKLSATQSRKVTWDFYLIKGLSDASPDFGGGLQAVYSF